MSKKSEDNLESFFRKAVNQSDSSFMERDWQAMEKKLDENPITGTFYRSSSRSIKIGITASALAVLFAAYFFIVRTDQPLVGGEDSAKQQAAAGVDVPKQQDMDKEENQTADLLLPAATSDDATTAAGDRPNESAGITIPSFAGSRENAQGPKTAQTRTAQRIEQAEPSAARASRLLNEPTDLPPETFQTGQSITPDRDQAALSSPKEQVEEEPVKQETIAGLSQEEAADHAAHPKESDESSKSNRSRWSIALAVAPDFSTTSLRSYSSPGSAVGILLGYQLRKRLSINVGLMRSSKRYTGEGYDYQPPYGYWKARTNGIVPNEIDGSCRIIEIPLIIHYDILQRTRSRLFAGGGISTYLMSEEQYQYSFSTPNPGADQGWSSEGAKSSYPLAIGHFSFGYERQISPRVNVGIEPFLKVPFAGIGWLDLKLFSTGAFVNVRYRLATSPRSWK